MPYTTPGLGDMLHTCRLGYSYAKHTGESVVLHMSADKFNRDKPEKWKNILKLFPKDSIHLKFHPKKWNRDEKEWDKYLRLQGVNALFYYYGKHPGGPLEYKNIEPLKRKSIDADKFLIYPQLSSKDFSNKIDLPDNYITMQGVGSNSTDDRSINASHIEGLKKIYKEKGYEIVMLGAGNTNPLLEGPESIPYIGYILSKAKLHVGIDSGFLHFAELYLKPEQIHLYAKKRPEYFKHILIPAHHVYRSVANGVQHKFVEDVL
jgi:hypothetical protein